MQELQKHYIEIRRGASQTYLVLAWIKWRKQPSSVSDCQKQIVNLKAQAYWIIYGYIWTLLVLILYTKNWFKNRIRVAKGGHVDCIKVTGSLRYTCSFQVHLVGMKRSFKLWMDASILFWARISLDWLKIISHIARNMAWPSEF